MNAVSQTSQDTILPRLEEALGSLKVKRMLGMVTLYATSRPFATIMDGYLFFRVDETNRADFDQAESKNPEEFLVPTSVFSSEMNYRQVPRAVLQDRATLTQWARKAVAVSEHAPGFTLR